MSTSLLEIRVRKDWQMVAEQAAARRARLWTLMQLVVVGAVLLLIGSQLLFPRWPWHGWLRMMLLSAIFWLLPLTTVYGTGQGHRGRYSRTAVAAIALAATFLLAYATYPLASTARGLVELPVGTMVLVPIISWLLLLWTAQKFPRQMRRLGWTEKHWLNNVLLGVGVGVILVLHLLVSSGLDILLSPASAPAEPSAILLWLILFHVGVGAPGEEMYFRGLGYDVQAGEADPMPAKSVIGLALLNLVIYLVPLSGGQDLGLRLWLFLYGGVFALVATYMRFRRRSLLPGLACNVLFGTGLLALMAS